MANNKYAYNKDVDEAKTARAMAKSLKISPKHSEKDGLVVDILSKLQNKY